MDFITWPQLWVLLGILFLIAELLSVSFVFAFLSVGAFITALATVLGVTPDLENQLFCFAAVTVLTLLMGRKPLRRWFDSRTRKQEYVESVGDKATVTETIPASGEGRIFYRGTEWAAVSENDESIMAGKPVVIRRMEGSRAVVLLMNNEQLTMKNG
ncbi:NfeD family protein [Larkinella rosea]|uniref:NfeD family protein n=1 Tax=Larkinella rosea TaxID=2025312 RepID=A0A3P1BI31_9BACT|nr:NfeD family protein [Larkinella rosea]RRB00739.1 NfeD family protein [Larkinella rosea]